MPLYSFHCPKCPQEDIELLRSPGDLRPPACVCGKTMIWKPPIPNLQTDTTFMANRSHGFGEDQQALGRALSKAKAAGVSVGNMSYSHQLASAPGALDGWFDGKDAVRRRCQEKGLTCEEVGVRSPVVEREPRPYRVSPGVVKARVEKLVEERGGDISAKEKAALTVQTAEDLLPGGEMLVP